MSNTGTVLAGYYHDSVTNGVRNKNVLIVGWKESDVVNALNDFTLIVQEGNPGFCMETPPRSAEHCAELPFPNGGCIRVFTAWKFTLPSKKLPNEEMDLVVGHPSSIVHGDLRVSTYSSIFVTEPPPLEDKSIYSMYL